MLREWTYAFVYPSSEYRSNELQPWMYHYNFHRPHSAVAHKPPITRLGFEGNNEVRNYTSTIRQTLPCACLSNRVRKLTNMGALNLPSKTLKTKASLLVMAEIMLQPKR